jgi:hypothetical protein
VIAPRKLQESREQGCILKRYNVGRERNKADIVGVGAEKVYVWGKRWVLEHGRGGRLGGVVSKWKGCDRVAMARFKEKSDG